MQITDDVPVWGETIDQKVLQQMQRCAGDASRAAMMADLHRGYSVPIGGMLIVIERKTSQDASRW